MTDPVAEASRRLQHNCSADGLGEIAAGAVFLSLPLLEAAKLLFDKPSTAWRALNIVEILILFPGIWVITWGLPRLRNRLFGEREGFMLPRLMPAGGRWRALAAIPVAAMTAVVLLLMRGTPWATAIGIFATGAIPGAALFWIGRSAGIPRYAVLGPLIVALALVLALLVADLEVALLWFFGASGAMLVAMGLVTLRRYVQSAPRIAA